MSDLGDVVFSRLHTPAGDLMLKAEDCETSIQVDQFEQMAITLVMTLNHRSEDMMVQTHAGLKPDQARALADSLNKAADTLEQLHPDFD